MSAAALAAAIKDVTQPGLFWGVARIGETATLYATEEQAISKAIPSRRAEFVAGRLAARRALAALGQPEIAIPMATDRTPVWPDGCVGSLSHANGWAVAVAGAAHRFIGLGVDLEPADPLDRDVIAIVADETELAGQTDRSLAARRVFGAKEAVFKAQYPSTGAMFGFDAVRINLSTHRAIFSDHPEALIVPRSWRRAVLRVDQSHDHGWILSVCAVSVGSLKKYG